MIERAGISLLIAGLAVGSYLLLTRWQIAHVQGEKVASRVLGGLRPGIPAVMYFWSETCVPCKAAQKPALEQLQAELGPDKVQVISVNAFEQPLIANEWGVLGLPTTFIVDRTGQPRHVNHGVTLKDNLKKQIMAVESGLSLRE